MFLKNNNLVKNFFHKNGEQYGQKIKPSSRPQRIYQINQHLIQEKPKYINFGLWTVKTSKSVIMNVSESDFELLHWQDEKTKSYSSSIDGHPKFQLPQKQQQIGHKIMGFFSDIIWMEIWNDQLRGNEDVVAHVLPFWGPTGDAKKAVDLLSSWKGKFGHNQ